MAPHLQGTRMCGVSSRAKSSELRPWQMCKCDKSSLPSLLLFIDLSWARLWYLFLLLIPHMRVPYKCGIIKRGPNRPSSDIGFVSKKNCCDTNVVTFWLSATTLGTWTDKCNETFVLSLNLCWTQCIFRQSESCVVWPNGAAHKHTNTHGSASSLWPTGDASNISMNELLHPGRGLKQTNERN